MRCGKRWRKRERRKVHEERVLFCLIIAIFAYHLVDAHYANKRIAALEEGMKKLGEEAKNE